LSRGCYAIVQRASLRPPTSGHAHHSLDPAVAQRRRSPLDACFDDATFLRHVPEVIARLDGLAEDLAARTAAAKATVPDAG
jgi:hypothetical protein